MSLVITITYPEVGSKQYPTIYFTDSVTHNPVAVKNMVVMYTEWYAGNPPQVFSIIATGTDYLIRVCTYNPLNRWEVGNMIDPPDPDPPGNTCDLSITSITVDKPESAPGSGDAQVTVTAFSSNPPLQYSRDNTNWQSSPTFTALPGGRITIYARDANGCTASSSVTILINSSLLVSDPSLPVDNAGNVSRWSAAFNPIVFTYQRRDFEVNGISQDSQTLKPLVLVNADVSSIQAAITANQNVISNAAMLGITIVNTQNIYVYLSASPYTGVYRVISATASSLIIDTPFTTAGGSGFINIDLLRPYYKVVTNITYIDPLTGNYNTISSVNRPNNKGLVKADISNFLQSILRAKDDSDYTLPNYRDSNLSASYTIQYAEQYDDLNNPGVTLPSQFIAIDAPYYVTYTARQLQSRFGGNIAQYVPFVNTGTPAKWVTDFAEPAYTPGYPFDISFIYSEALLGRDLYYTIDLLDINRRPVATSSITSSLLNEDTSWLLNQDASKLLIAAAGLQRAISAIGQLGLNRLLIDIMPDLPVYYLNIAVLFNDMDDNAVQVTQTQTIRVDHAPVINSVYMRWIGLIGAWNYYRFNYNQEITLDVQNATIIKNFVQDWKTQDSIEEVISKDAGQKMKLMAEDLSIADIKGLQSIKYSPKVQMLVNTNPVQWQTVVLNTATFAEYDTINGHAPFSITFNQPSINIQTQ